MSFTSTYFEDEHRHLDTDAGIEIIVERFRTNREGDVVADVQPREAMGDGFLPPEKLNLSSARSIKTYANTLAARPLQGDIDWFALLSKAAQDSVMRLREGDPHVWLDDVTLDDVSRWLVEPFVVDRAISMIYGSGGSAKSVFALTLALAVVSGENIGGLESQDVGPVLVLDWEDDAETWAERWNALCAGHDVTPPEHGIAYQRMTQSLHDSAREVRKRIATTGARFVILDSVGMASGGDPNEAGTIMRTLLAARSLGVPVLAIHHIAKDSKDPIKSGPYGSVYATNEVRQSWYVATDQPEGSSIATMVLANQKPNRSAKIERKGFRVAFEDGPSGLLKTIAIASTEAKSLPTDGSDKYERRWQLMQFLASCGTATYEQCATHLDTSQANVRSLVNRNKEIFTRQGVNEDGFALIGVHSDRDDDPRGVPRGTATARGVAQGALIKGPATQLEEEEEEEAPF